MTDLIQRIETAPEPSEALGEALYALSARLLLTKWLDDPANHEAYERVVKAFNAPFIATCPAANVEAEPVAWMYERDFPDGRQTDIRVQRQYCTGFYYGWAETPLYPASALEAARREDQARIAELEACIDLVIPDDCKSQLHEDATNMLKLQARIAALEAKVKEAGEALAKHGRHKRGCSVFPRGTRHLAQCSCGLSATLAKIKETPDA